MWRTTLPGLADGADVNGKELLGMVGSVLMLPFFVAFFLAALPVAASWYGVAFAFRTIRIAVGD